VGVTWVTNVPNKEEALVVSTAGVVDKDKFPSPYEKPKIDGFMPKDCVVTSKW
jgi:hypothetical protein